MEYVSGGDLFDYLESHGRMEEPEARAKFMQIVSAVEYCHEKGIVHRDLKDSNILLDSEMNIKVTDFGLSNEFTPGYELNTFCGSPHFAAPEIFLRIKYDGPEVDVWSLGVILFVLVTRTLPFDGPTLHELRKRVLSCEYEIPSYVSTECGNILKTLLVRDRFKRASLEIIRNDKWLNQEYEMCTSF
nr:serine/threonine-protein kinase MARK1-like [Leptinotarsa decemlineata]